MEPSVVLAGAAVGLLVGMTGAGGGALMTPMLVVLFGMKPSTAISSDLVAALFMRPVGAAVHGRRGTVDLRLVGLLSAGSVPMALAGSWLLHLVGHAHGAETAVRRALGAALVVGAGAMAVRALLDRRTGRRRTASVRQLRPRPIATVLVGMVGGLVVGATSVGSGSLMVVLLLCLYPAVGAEQLVGTDLAQAVPLTLAAAVGALAFGHVAVPVSVSLVAGGVPAVVVGSLVSSRVPHGVVRPAVTAVVLASGLQQVGVPAAAVGCTIGAVLVLAAGGWLARWARRRARLLSVPVPVPGGAVPGVPGGAVPGVPGRAVPGVPGGAAPSRAVPGPLPGGAVPGVSGPAAPGRVPPAPVPAGHVATGAKALATGHAVASTRPRRPFGRAIGRQPPAGRAQRGGGRRARRRRR